MGGFFAKGSEKMAAKCRLCGGKLKQNRCELCGLDNSVYDREERELAEDKRILNLKQRPAGQRLLRGLAPL